MLAGIVVQACLEHGKGCTALFDKKQVTIIHNGKPVLIRHRDQTTRMWHVPLTAPVAFSIVPALNTVDMIRYLHATAFYPVKSTLLQAISKGFFQSWPGLSYKRVAKHLPKVDATIKGHLDQERCNTRLSKNETPLQPAPDTPTPCARRPSSFANDRSQHDLVVGSLISWRYSSSWPVFGWTTE